MVIQAPSTLEEASRNIPRDQYWRGKAKVILLRHIKKNPVLMERAGKIRTTFPRFRCVPWVDTVCPTPGCPIGKWDERGSFEIGAGVDEDSDEVRYSREIEAFARDLGLRSEWGPEGAHYLVHWGPVYPGISWTAAARIVPITVPVRVSRGTTWSAVRDQVLQEAKKQFDAAVRPLREQSGFPERDRGPENLDRNVDLLYQRICLGLEPLEIWNAWERDRPIDEALTYEHVRNIISSTAKLLGIEL